MLKSQAVKKLDPGGHPQSREHNRDWMIDNQ